MSETRRRKPRAMSEPRCAHARITLPDLLWPPQGVGACVGCRGLFTFSESGLIGPLAYSPENYAKADALLAVAKTRAAEAKP